MAKFMVFDVEGNYGSIGFNKVSVNIDCISHITPHPDNKEKTRLWILDYDIAYIIDEPFDRVHNKIINFIDEQLDTVNYNKVINFLK